MQKPSIFYFCKIIPITIYLYKKPGTYDDVYYKKAYFFVIIDISVKNMASCYFCFILAK